MKTSCFLFDFLFFLWHYKFSTVYGPDEQRMKVEHEVTWNHGEINKKYYAPDYEEEDFYNRKRQLHYIYGGNGLAAVCIIENGGTTVYSAYTDFQGSLVALTSHGLIIEKYAYDPWGLRRNPQDWTKSDERKSYDGELSPYFTDRGYTMHEHIPGTDLIDMNGRVYDCTTATFLTCDPYVQDPGNWLNHNPYTYCLNNPLKYTDPSGEIWWLVPAFCAAVFGTGNLLAHIDRGDVGSFGEGLKFFGQGALAGFALGSLWQFSPGIPIVGEGLHSLLTKYAFAQGLFTGVGLASGAVASLWQGPEAFVHSVKMAYGNFYLDENSFFGGILQGISRHSWEMGQTLLGQGYSQIRNVIAPVDRVDYMAGATFVTHDNSSSHSGVTLGNFINIKYSGAVGGDFETFVTTGDPSWIYLHEYGHTIDSRLWGPGYAVIATLSLGNAMFKNSKSFWTERRANRLAKRYMERYYQVDWEAFLKKRPI